MLCCLAFNGRPAEEPGASFVAVLGPVYMLRKICIYPAVSHKPLGNMKYIPNKEILHKGGPPRRYPGCMNPRGTGNMGNLQH